MKVTTPKQNPLANMTFDWTEEMAADYRKYEDDVKTVFPGCRFTNATTVVVSRMSGCFPVVVPAEENS